MIMQKAINAILPYEEHSYERVKKQPKYRIENYPASSIENKKGDERKSEQSSSLSLCLSQAFVHKFGFITSQFSSPRRNDSIMHIKPISSKTNGILYIIQGKDTMMCIDSMSSIQKIRLLTRAKWMMILMMILSTGTKQE